MTNQPTNKLNLNFGIILGALLSLFTAYSYAIDSSMYFSYLALAILLLSVPVLGIIAIIAAKRKSGGYISFKDGLKNYTITIALGLLISTATSILIFNIVDTNFYKVVQQVQVDGLEKQKERTLQQLYNANSSDERVEQTEKGFDLSIEKLQSTNAYELSAQIINFIKSVGAYLIFGLILALLLQKKDPELV